LEQGDQTLEGRILAGDAPQSAIPET